MEQTLISTTQFAAMLGVSKASMGMYRNLPDYPTPIRKGYKGKKGGNNFYREHEAKAFKAKIDARKHKPEGQITRVELAKMWGIKLCSVDKYAAMEGFPPSTGTIIANGGLIKLYDKEAVNRFKRERDAMPKLSRTGRKQKEENVTDICFWADYKNVPANRVFNLFLQALPVIVNEID